MSEPSGNDWGPQLWQVILTAASLVASFVAGVWANARASGASQGQIVERLNAQSGQISSMQVRLGTSESNIGSNTVLATAANERVNRLEARFESLDAKVNAVSARVAEMPTRTEMLSAFSRLENRFDHAVATFKRDPG